jgi:acetyl esterase
MSITGLAARPGTVRDEGEDYAKALQEAGTPATLRRFPGFTHAFIGAAWVSRTCRDAVIEIAGATRAMFGSVPASD